MAETQDSLLTGTLARLTLGAVVNPAFTAQSSKVNIVACQINEDFNFQRNPCSPYTVDFKTTSITHTYIKWLTGDGYMIVNQNSITHTFSDFGNYQVKMILSNATCTDTISKTISVDVVQDDMIITPDTTICAGAAKLLRTRPALKFCWFPVTFLDNPNSPNPVTTSPNDITYYLNSESSGNNLITNGNFSGGNSGFSSAYNYTSNNVTEGQYFVGTDPRAWNRSLGSCVDHTSGNGNMMLVNGSPAPNVEVWK
ncbi:MAG: hypothetical protein WKF97_04470 [Chitinophagaceae bacterium]